MAFMDASRRDCLSKMKKGAMLGGAVGAASGFLFGSYEAAQIRGIPVPQVRRPSGSFDDRLGKRMVFSIDIY